MRKVKAIGAYIVTQLNLSVWVNRRGEVKWDDSGAGKYYAAIPLPGVKAHVLIFKRYGSGKKIRDWTIQLTKDLGLSESACYFVPKRKG
jgi:hypothetical protein